jgi:hypothetical protein
MEGLVGEVIKIYFVGIIYLIKIALTQYFLNMKQVKTHYELVKLILDLIDEEFLLS